MSDASTPAEAGGARLDSWKEIAAYLGRQVRTVQGWERDEGLPIHRLPHKSKGSVFAYKEELDQWRTRHAMPPAAPPSPTISRGWGWRRAAAGALVGIVGLGLAVLEWSHWRPETNPAEPAASALLPLTARYLAQYTRAGGQMPWIAKAAPPDFLALDRSGRYLYAAGRSGRVERIATSTDSVIGQWSLPGQISGLTVGSDGNHLFLAGTNPLLYVLDLTSGHILAINLPGAAVSESLSAGGKSLYLAMPNEGLEMVDTSSLKTTHWPMPPCPMAVAPDTSNNELFVSFQCNGPGGTPGHDAIGIYNAGNGQLISSLAGEPRVGRTVAIGPGGNEIWTDSGTACEEPQYDHRGCASVPSEVLEVLGLGNHQMRMSRAIATAGKLPHFGMITFFPGGARAFDGAFIVDTTRLNVLEVVPSAYRVLGVAAIQPDSSHAYVVLDHDGNSALADLAPTSLACAPSTRDLLNWWPGDGSADDAWGIENGQPSSSAAYAPGISGQAFDLSGAGAEVTIGPDHGLDLQLRAVTISAWVKIPDDGEAHAILTKMPASGRSGWSLSLNPSHQLVFCQGGGNADGCRPGSPTLFVAPLKITPGAFHSVVLRAGQPWGELYLDGNLAGRTRLFPASTSASGTPLVFGADAGHQHFLRGLLDEVMVYSRALSTAEIASLAHMPACLAENHQ